MSKAEVGRTKDVGFQIGVRRSFAVSPQRAWSVLASQQGLALWLGDVEDFELVPGASYRTHQGTVGTLRVVKPGSHVRLTWQPVGWPRASTLQVRVLPSSSSDKTALSFHHEHLRDARQREQMHQHWLGVIEQLAKLFED